MGCSVEEFLKELQDSLSDDGYQTFRKAMFTYSEVSMYVHTCDMYM